jgi:DNA replicative helicase MCM subunit Mcm2 (Cdc46/Mcm family)
MAVLRAASAALCLAAALVPAPARALGHVDAALLTDYISYARAHVHPQLSDAAAEALVEVYEVF